MKSGRPDLSRAARVPLPYCSEIRSGRDVMYCLLIIKGWTHSNSGINTKERCVSHENNKLKTIQLSDWVRFLVCFSGGKRLQRTRRGLDSGRSPVALRNVYTKMRCTKRLRYALWGMYSVRRGASHLSSASRSSCDVMCRVKWWRSRKFSPHTGHRSFSWRFWRTGSALASRRCCERMW